jgi:hypothetical protein
MVPMMHDNDLLLIDNFPKHAAPDRSGLGC